MQSYSSNRKAAILKKLRPPFNESVRSLSTKEDIPVATIYTWLKSAKGSGEMGSKKVSTASTLSAESRFTIIVETALMNEQELSEYCRERGLYPEQIKTWKQECISGMTGKTVSNVQEKAQTQKDKKTIQQLEKELNRKEKALAEAAALLILRKKLRAFYEEGSEDD